jgi:hypothetical protein
LGILIIEQNYVIICCCFVQVAKERKAATYVVITAQNTSKDKVQKAKAKFCNANKLDIVLTLPPWAFS